MIGPLRRATARATAEQAVAAYLQRAGIEHEPGARPGEFVVTLPGEHKLRTAVSLLVGDHSLSASAFVVRHADENHEEFYRWLLERNARLPGIAFAVDQVGDVYLVGRLPLAAVDDTSWTRCSARSSRRRTARSTRCSRWASSAR